MKDIVVIPDIHADPEFDNERMKWVARYILDKQPDEVVQLGDFGTLRSLGGYDEGKLSGEGLRYADDVNAIRDALRKFHSVFNKYNNTRSKWKKKQYKPKMVMTVGNHEQRIVRACQENPKWYGHISLDDFKFRDYGWELYDFLKPYETNGVVFQHYFTSGIMGRAIGGEHHAASLISKNYVSSVCGHSHMRCFHEKTNAVGKNIFGLVCGCYFEHEESYTSENKRFWRGIVHLKQVQDGQCEPEFININMIKERYK